MLNIELTCQNAEYIVLFIVTLLDCFTERIQEILFKKNLLRGRTTGETM